jgi:ABC-type glycerol-3-phosphate transport system substrate-binding protein
MGIKRRQYQAAYSCSIVLTSPQARHRKVSNSAKAATLGVVRTSIISFPQAGHGRGGSSSSFWDINVHVPNSTSNQKEAAKALASFISSPTSLNLIKSKGFAAP